MYLIPITVPIFRDDGRLLIATDWKRALALLRDSLGGRYGPLAVAAPWLAAAESEHVLESATLADDEIALIPTFYARERLRSYWSGTHRRALDAVAAYLSAVKVVHGTVEDALRPFCYSAFMMASRADIPSVFVQDQDVVSVIRDLHKDDGAKARLKAELQARLHERQCRSAVAVAGVSFLKGRGTVKRYGGLTEHLLQIEDTSYFSKEIIARDAVQARVRSLVTGSRPLRFGFAGRLVDIKGVDRSIRIIHKARARGAKVVFDIIGSGPEESGLRHLATELGIENAVSFHGAMTYGPALLQHLGQCDALLFNPRMEETPRMIFDGYAAGLPLVAGGIAYVKERAESDGAAIVLPRDDDDAAVSAIIELDRNREILSSLADKALAAAEYHAADNWYARRAQATHEMVDRHWRGRTPPAQRAPLTPPAGRG